MGWKHELQVKERHVILVGFLLVSSLGYYPIISEINDASD